MIEILLTPFRKLFMFLDKLFGITREGKRNKSFKQGVRLTTVDKKSK